MFTSHQVTKIDDYSYVITCITSKLSGDVECLINPTGEEPKDAWVFQIKDCSHYQPTQPQQPTGKDYLCVNTDSITTYTSQFANGAWAYEWELAPEEAGILESDSLTAQIHWNPMYEGSATIKVRSSNDCGESAWSDSLVVQTYMCLGSEEYANNKNVVSIYPNPAKTKLYIRYNKPNYGSTATIEVYNMFGRIASTIQVDSNLKGCIDVTNWATGLYFVKVVVDDNIADVSKVVVE